MHILFMGCLFPKEKEIEICSKSHGIMVDAAIALQWNLIDGIEDNLGKSIDILNRIPVSSYPHFYDDWYVKSFSFSHKEGAHDISVGFINITKIKHLLTKHIMVKPLLKWCREHVGEKVIYVYSLNAIAMNAVQYAKRHFPDVKCCVIVADLPRLNDLNGNRSMIQKLFLSMQASIAVNTIDQADAFVLLTEQMREALHIHKPTCVMEGIAGDISLPTIIPTMEKMIVYTGTLHKCFGVMNLIQAFSMMPDPEFRLVICGIGDSEKEIQMAALKDNRIVYKGQVTRDEALRLQASATVLVNPRMNDHEFTKYSFPSKTMEYLASGKPVIAYMLDGMPDEYRQYLVCVPDTQIDTLAQTIRNTINLSEAERNRIGSAGRAFVLSQKNRVAQTKKILALMNISKEE